MKTTIRDRNTIGQVKGTEEAVVLSTGVTENTTRRKGIYITEVTLASQTVAVANTAKSFGKALFTFPVGRIIVMAAYMEVTYSCSVTCTLQADIGIGSTIGTGTDATLGASVTAKEDIIDGQTATAFSSSTPVTFTYLGRGEIDLADGSSSAITAYLNMAQGWSGVTGDVTYSAKVSIVWTFAD